MKIFTRKLSELFSGSRRSVPLAPRDVLFEAQLPFFKQGLENIVGVKLLDTYKPGTDDAPYAFRLKVALKANISQVLHDIKNLNWGDFTIKQITIKGEVLDSNYAELSIKVGLRT